LAALSSEHGAPPWRGYFIIVQSEEEGISIWICRIKNIFENILPAWIPALSQGYSKQFRTVPGHRSEKGPPQARALGEDYFVKLSLGAKLP
jgi:hypothetical protein